ncbi:eRF1 domain 1-domain-containing protein [Boletus edulis BED1]|uniref:ERF1 domain 1-domain-containing protein n=1 Tax=Boletus edulis BED1 TaxID=1328754 RepID=A0AAD4GKY3_BOLED|nr:eRF1 domain 1-domain-containing protein [Boletus edulis BED1]
MKLIGKYVDKSGTGHVTLRPEDDEDMWHLYNIIQQDDLVRAPAIRRVQNVSATGSIESHRIRLKLTLQVSKMEYSSSGVQSSTTDQAVPGSPSSSAPSPTTVTLHISGRVTSENEHVRMGAFHTLDIEPNRDVRIEKIEGWDSIALSRVQESCVPGRGAEVGAVVCGEGTAAFCLLSQHLTVITHRLSVPIPRKASAPGTSQHEKAMTKFYTMVYDAPGWIRDTVYSTMMNEAGKRNDKLLAKSLREKGLKVHISSAHVHSLVEVLKSPEIVARLKETKFAREGIVLDKFFKMLASDEMRAWYGPEHVCLAADRGAVGTLLISDGLFRASDPKTRKRYVSLVESVQQKGAEVVIFSSMHESGQQLNQLTGVAAILTFPLDIEVVEAEEKEAVEEAERDRLEKEEAVG